MNIENRDAEKFLLDLLFVTNPPPFSALLPQRFGELPLQTERLSKITLYRYEPGIRYDIYYKITNKCIIFHPLKAIEQHVFFNDAALTRCHPVYGFIFTDNVFIAKELAGQVPWLHYSPVCNPSAGAIDNRFFIWISLCCNQEDWSTLLWNKFKGKRVFYYLCQHSGFNMGQTWDRAKVILEHLNNAGVGEVIFLYYAPGDKFPMFMTSEQFMKNINEIKDDHIQTPAILKLQDISPPRSYIVNPLILERTATLFHSSKNSDRTQLLLDLAIATSQGKHSVNSWSVSKACKVVYIHHNCDNIDFCNLVEQSMLSSSPSLKGCIQFPTLPKNTINDDSVTHCLLPAGTFQEYPQLINLNKKCVERNFIYFSFCGTMNLGGFSNILNYIPGDTALLILDIPFLWSIIEYEKMWAVFNATLFQLRSNYAVLMGFEAYSPKMALKINNLPFDKIIKLQRLTHEDPESTLLKLIPERTSTKNSNKSMSIMKSQGQVWTEYRSRKLSSNDLKKIISKNYSIVNKNKKTAKQLALKLGVSESYIKKLKKNLNLTEDMPQRKPRNPHKKSNNLYVDPNDIKL